VKKSWSKGGQKLAETSPLTGEGRVGVITLPFIPYPMGYKVSHKVSGRPEISLDKCGFYNAELFTVK